jgi:hypothetical protein
MGAFVMSDAPVKPYLSITCKGNIAMHLKMVNSTRSVKKDLSFKFRLEYLTGCGLSEAHRPSE